MAEIRSRPVEHRAKATTGALALASCAGARKKIRVGLEMMLEGLDEIMVEGDGRGDLYAWTLLGGLDLEDEPWTTGPLVAVLYLLRERANLQNLACIVDPSWWRAPRPKDLAVWLLVALGYTYHEVLALLDIASVKAAREAKGRAHRALFPDE